MPYDVQDFARTGDCTRAVHHPDTELRRRQRRPVVSGGFPGFLRAKGIVAFYDKFRLGTGGSHTGRWLFFLFSLARPAFTHCLLQPHAEELKVPGKHFQRNRC